MLLYTIIESLEQNSSRLAKEAIILKQAEQSNNEFFNGVQIALNSLITFGIKKVPVHSGPDGQGLPWPVFAKLVDQLQKRELTGNEAKQAIELTMSIATQAEWNDWYRRILIKDLRCGVSEKTINNVVKKKYPQYKIPVFTCQLAEDSTNHEKKLTSKKILQEKLDGMRVLTIVYPNGRVDQYSRNGKELVNFEHIKEQFKKTCVGITEPTVFDGEVISSSFQELMKQAHRKENVNANDAVLHLFDYIPLSKFELGKWNKPQIERAEKLKAYKELWLEETPNIQVLPFIVVDLDTDEGKHKYSEFNREAINCGKEGIMIKSIDAPYELKRSANWLKLKPFIEVSLEIINVEEGTGRNEHRLGAFVCKGIDDGRNITVNVGSGFSDEQRDDFWINRQQLIGHLVEVRADAVTQNQDGSYSLRFPRFVRFRGFEKNEKL